MSDHTTDVAESVAGILREQVEVRKGPSDETIIVFEYCYDTTAKKKERVYYTFVSIWIESQGNWYSSGRGGGVPRESTHDEFMKILASHHVRKASVATEFEQFKP
jgi:hypothetical protein